MIVAVVAIISVVLLGVVMVWHHQSLLADRAQLMRDAMRHRDFSFRLQTKGLLFGERALQEALNDMGHDIEKLVAYNEVEAWQRLTRVLTHEIMNVTTPIRSISQAYLANPAIKGTAYEEGIRAIYDASTGLASFVDNYRKMTQLQEPVMMDIDLGNFFDSIASLYPGLKWSIELPPQFHIRADEVMLRQIFINLVKNAVEAEAKSIGIKYIEPSATHNGAYERVRTGLQRFGTLYVSNDGHVIPDEVARQIFIPFFTTRQGGSGIGLSLSRRLLMMQGLLLTLAEHPLPGYNVTFLIESDRS